jgi:excisionase family DNA binding protein
MSRAAEDGRVDGHGTAGTSWQGPDDELLTASEVASLYKVPTSTVRAWAREGRLPCLRLGPRATRWTRPMLREFRDRSLDPGRGE